MPWVKRLIKCEFEADTGIKAVRKCESTNTSRAVKAIPNEQRVEESLLWLTAGIVHI